MHIARNPFQRVSKCTPRAQKVFLGLFLFPTICLLILLNSDHASPSTASSDRSPVSDDRIREVTNGHGGSWIIPKSWKGKDTSDCDSSSSKAVNIIDAAECALRLALANNAFLENSGIPLIAHQTSRSADPRTWSSVVRNCVERWISATTGWDDPANAEMAWFMWDDDGIDAFIQKFESDFLAPFSALPYPVEKADAFRMLVLKWFGGVYGDIDSQPLRHPSKWVQANDLNDWLDEEGNKHVQYQPPRLAYIAPDGAPPSYMASSGTLRAERSVAEKGVNAMFGIEADNLPEPDDTYWRMGYTYPVQITNWALAMAPHHAIADQFLSGLKARIQEDMETLPYIDPLNITGPPALTRVVKEFAESAEPNFSWQSLSSRGDDIAGGRAKIVTGDVLILPITGFSPGRGWLGNMGSRPTSHPEARLQHMAAGSWKKADLRVSYGKFCRTAFGMCREWSKIPEPEL